MIAHNVQSSRAALLRDTLQSSELLVKEISHVLTCYGDHLDELANSVETVAFRAQALTTAQKKIDSALQQTNLLVEQLSIPRLVESKIKAGPKAAGLSTFLTAWQLLQQSIVVLRRYRGQYIATDVLELAESLDKEACRFASSDFQQLVKRFSTVPSLQNTPTPDMLKIEFLEGYQELVPHEVANRLMKLYGPISQSGNSDCIKTYVAVRWSVLEKYQASNSNSDLFEEFAKLPWPELEKRFRRWVEYFSRVPIYLVQEKNLAFQIFGKDVGLSVLLEIVKPAHIVSTSMLAGLLGYKRIPDKIFTLLEVGKKMTGQSKEVIDYLPLEMTKGRVAHIALSCVKESRATFAAFCAKISHDASKHTVGNGSIHPLAAQTITVVRRLLLHSCAPEVIFSDAEPHGGEWTDTPGAVSPTPDIQRNVEKPLDQIWLFLSVVAASCKNKALAALFLMNNAHYQLKSITSTRLQNYVSKGFQDDCETKLEEYGALYQRCAWGPLLALMIDPDTTAKKIPWEKEKASIKERWRQFNAGLMELIEHHRLWLVPDAGLRENLCDAILEDFVVPYRKFWACYQVLPFSRDPSKYLRIPPDALADIIQTQLLRAQLEPVERSNSGKS